MNDNRFWQMIEAAWDFAPPAERRRTDAFLAKMTGYLAALSRKDLVGFDDALSRWMYALDSEKLATLTDTGDDGFADARAHTIALGRAHCMAVLANPVTYEAGHLESFLYLAEHIHQRRFRERLPPSTLSRATASNPDGWPGVGARLARDLRRRVMRTELRKIGDFVSDGTPFVAPPEIALEGDDGTWSTNCRRPSYGIWEDFCRKTGLREVLLDRRTGLMRNHPGTEPITTEHVRAVQRALRAYKAAHPGAEPGFIGDQDSHLARLEWLAWWMAWALETCRRPALFNK